MSSSAIIWIVLVQGFVTILTIWFLVKILRSGKKE